MNKQTEVHFSWNTVSLFLLFLLFFKVALWSQEEVETGFEANAELSFQQANRLMLDDNYSGAIELYNKVLTDHETATVNHNLGVAYYMDGETGMAVLHLERALRLGFASTGTREILSLLRNSEGINSPRYTLLQRLARSLPEGVWMLLVVSSFWCAALFGIFVYGLVNRQSLYRDVAWVCVLVFIVSCVGCIGLAQDAKHGVLVGDGVGMKVVPTSETEDFLTFKSGEMARYLKTNNNFIFIESSGGVRGWVPIGNFQWVLPRY